MGFLDDFFDTKIVEPKDTKINYTPMKLSSLMPSTKKNVAKIKDNNKRTNILKECGKWVYINSVEWCIAMKGTHIYKMCMEEIFDNLESRKGIPCCDFTETLVPEWVDYWYDGSNHKHYTRQQLKRVEREFDAGRDSEELVCEMLDYVWFNILPKEFHYEELDDLIIYKLRVRWLK